MSVTAICAVTLAACGGGTGGSAGPTGAARTVPSSPAPNGPLDLPRGVPLRSSGAPADAGQAKVIRAWTDALRAGDVAAASALWAVPSKVQNGTPVVELRSSAAVRLFQASLPCGARVTASARAPRDFTIVTVRLTQRRGADCGSGTGASARTAIRVVGGKIVEWYRLPDDPGGPGPAPPPPSDGSGGTTV